MKNMVRVNQVDCEEQRPPAVVIHDFKAVPSFSRWRSWTRLVAFLDMVFAWIWIGFCSSFLTKLSLTLVMTSEEHWTIDVQIGKLIVVTFWITLLSAILGKCLGLWTIMKLMQAVYFAETNCEADKLTTAWRCYSSTCLLLCPVVVVALHIAIFLISASPEFVAFLISFIVILVYGWFWRAISFYVVSRFLKELENPTTIHLPS